MMPNGYGAAYYSGWTKIGRKIRYGTPIKNLNGVWKVVAVILENQDAEAKYEYLEADLNLEIQNIDINTGFAVTQENYIEKKTTDLDKPTTVLPAGDILWKILYPTLDIITLYPEVWISGIGPNNGKIYINDDERVIKTFDTFSHFWEPFQLQKGSQVLAIESRMEGNAFRHEINVYYLETTNEIIEILKEPLKQSIILKGTYQRDGLQTKLDCDYKFGKTLKWIYPQNETTTLAKTIRIYGEVNEQVDNLTLNDRQEIPLIKNNTGKIFDLTFPVKIGTTELVLRTMINGEIAEVQSRNVNVQLSPNTLSNLKIVRPQPNFLISDKSLPIIVEGFTTPGSVVTVNNQTTISDNEGHFLIKILLDQKIIAGSAIKLVLNSIWDPSSVKFSDFYEFARPLTMNIDCFDEIQSTIREQLQKNGWNTLDQVRNADIRILAKNEEEIGKYLHITHYASLLLVSKENLAIFTSYEALALAKLSYASLEALILEKPENLLKKFYELKMEKISIEDIQRWQQSLDDFLFDIQNVWL